MDFATLLQLTLGSLPKVELFALACTMFQETETSPRLLRYQIEHKKLATKALSVASVLPGVRRCELDLRIGEMAFRAAFGRHDLVALRIWTPTCVFTLVLVPLRLWYKGLWRGRAIELRDYIRAAGIRCIVAPSSAVAQQPRLRNAQLINACQGFAVCVSDQVRVVSKIIESGGMSLQDAASMIRASDPAAAILSLVSKKLLIIELDTPIGPHSVLTAAG